MKTYDESTAHFTSAHEAILTRRQFFARSAAAMALAVMMCARAFAAESVALKLDRGAVPAGEWVPLGVGVPLKEGMVKVHRSSSNRRRSALRMARCR